MKTYILLFALLTSLPLNSYAAVEYGFIVPTKLVGLDGISDLTVTGLTNDQQISGTYKHDGQINYFFYDFKDKSRITLQGAKGLTVKGNALPFDISGGLIWNKNGQAAGIFIDQNEQRHKGFIYTDGAYTIMSESDGSVEPNLTLSGISGFNDLGQALLFYRYYVGDLPPSPYPTYSVYKNGRISTEPLPLYASSMSASYINNSGQVVGIIENYEKIGAAFKAKAIGFLHGDNGFTYLDTPNPIGKLIINDIGQVYNIYSDSYEVLHVEKYDQGVYTRIDPPPAPGVRVSIYSCFVNNNGQIVGDYTSLNNTNTGGIGIGASLGVFLYDKGVYTRLNIPGAFTASETLSSFNDSGQIVGSYFENNTNVYRSFVANPLDTFDPATQTLHMNNVLFEGKMYHDVSVTVKRLSVISIASSVAKGSIATEVTNPVDTFDPATNMLTLNAVVVGDTQYNQVVLKLMDYQLQP